ncbi:MAG: NUDIX domain-containing protein [Actinomycetota bacterium]|nr:NUDIX domain-containing protein [Actinomycetota bacterium]
MTDRTKPRKSSPRSAGLLLYRVGAAGLEVLLVHPGGPFWARRDAGAWSIPKGEYEPGEEPLDAARREFSEELGGAAPDGEPIDLGEVRLKSGKAVRAWAVAGDFDPETLASNTFTMQWPPRSGQSREFPEVDRAQWFALKEARVKLNPAQVALLDRLPQMP